MSREHSLQVKRIKRFSKVVLESRPSSVTGVGTPQSLTDITGLVTVAKQQYVRIKLGN